MLNPLSPRARISAFIVIAAALLWLQPGLAQQSPPAVAMSHSRIQAAPTAATPVEQSDGPLCECEGCTSILVGKAASADGSTMTSHSCDSTTDRTWMNMVPRATHKPGETATLWMDPKEIEGAGRSGPRAGRGYPAGAARPTQFLNAAYPIMNEHQLAIGETTFGGQTRTEERHRHHRLPRALPPGAGAREDGARGHPDCRRADEAVRLQRLRRGLHLRRQGRGLVLRDPRARAAARRAPSGRRCAFRTTRWRCRPTRRGSGSSNLKDPDTYMASANMHTLAEELGWWSAKSGEPFEFCTVYGIAHRAGQPPPRVARAQPPGAVAAPRSERRALPAVGEAREEAVGARTSSTSSATRTRARRTT